LQGDYVVYLGGIETYGKFIEMPFPTLVEQATGTKSVNLGCVNAGIDAFLTDNCLMDMCAGAKVTVVQVVGAQNMSNRFYAVHPRRNDRFVRASSLLRSIYSDVDFTDFSFTRHLLSVLAKTDPDKFNLVKVELKTAWISRMRSLIRRIGGNVVLLWLADHPAGDGKSLGPNDEDPLFVDAAMTGEIAPLASAFVEVVAKDEERTEAACDLVYGPLERPAAKKMLGTAVHWRAATELASVIQKFA